MAPPAMAPMPAAIPAARTTSALSLLSDVSLSSSFSGQAPVVSLTVPMAVLRIVT